KQKNFLGNTLFSEEHFDLQYFGLASFIGWQDLPTFKPFAHLKDFGSIRSLGDIQQYFDDLSENSMGRMNLAILFGDLSNNTCGPFCYFTGNSFSTVSFVLSTWWPDDTANGLWWAFAGYFANNVKRLGQLTQVVRKGAVNVGLLKKYVTNNTIEWDLSRDEPDDWQTSFYRAFDCEI
ncbi:hypothetical protein AAVH_35184, partial [Aphelenchoides avenae]